MENREDTKNNKLQNQKRGLGGSIKEVIGKKKTKMD